MVENENNSELDSEMEDNQNDNTELEEVVENKPNHHNDNSNGDGLAVAALVLGIVGFVIGLIPFFGWVVFPCWFLAIVFGIITLKNPNGKGKAITGIILGSLSIVWKVFFWTIVIINSFSMNITDEGFDDDQDVTALEEINVGSSEPIVFNKYIK